MSTLTQYPGLLTIGEASQRFAIPRPTLYRWVRTKRLWCIRAGKLPILVLPSDVAKLKEESHLEVRGNEGPSV